MFLALIRRGDVVFDVGANAGYFTLLFSDLAGPTGEVHAFEPVSRTFTGLERNLTQQKGFDNLRLNQVACGEEEGQVEMHVPGDDYGQASMRIQGSGSWSKSSNVSTETAKAIKLDGYSHGDLSPDFLKCDVEGAELLGLRGMKEKLARFQPLLFVEVCAAWMRNFGHSPRELISFVQSLGYNRFYGVTETVRPFEDVEMEIARQGDTSFNILCAVDFKHDQRIVALRNI